MSLFCQRPSAKEYLAGTKSSFLNFFKTSGLNLTGSLSKSEIDQIEKYLDKYVDEDALFDMCNDFYVEDEEWQDVKNDLDKADLISWALSYIKSNNLKLKDIKSIFEHDINEAKILTRDEMMNTMRTKYGLNFVKK